MISVIIPTLGNRKAELIRLLISLEKQTDKNFEVIVVSQDNHLLVSELLANTSFVYKHIKLEKKGLSIARNQGLKAISGSIVTFSDDDCWYPSDAFIKVNTYFNQNDGDVLCFKIYDPVQNTYYKEYSNKENPTISQRDVLRKSSIEVFIKTYSIFSNRIQFNENFGLGAKYPSGEENIFLTKLLKSGVKISYFPEIIVYHLKPSQESRTTEKQVISKGPLFKELYNTPIAIFLLTFFFIRKHHSIQEPIKTFKKAIVEMFSYKQ
ncbi:glycosyltransferase [Bacillus carboniphilus]|uniref:Glycosyltransferase n=1 Tax=Bacillus carboniphilus TaxID=86663 RepID=A0ABY9JSV6_9BACI|nr:glycosyltransferase family 2 protein [Bacillus carboniphilus]WLR41505.1 glycosyltransferase [Bacillus carboniphilus]